MTAWQKLIVRYAGRRQICNCDEAYYDKDGRCRSGCSANQIIAKEEIAKKVLRDLRKVGLAEEER